MTARGDFIERDHRSTEQGERRRAEEDWRTERDKLEQATDRFLFLLRAEQQKDVGDHAPVMHSVAACGEPGSVRGGPNPGD